MIRTTFALTLLLATLGNAGAQLRPIEIIERSYELDLASITFPTGPSGSVIVKPCATCNNVIHRVDAATTYLLNRTPVPFEDFMRMVETRRGTDNGRTTSVGVYYDIKTTTVKRILLSYAAQ